MDINNQVLTSIAVSATEQLLNNHVPLNESLAKQAEQYSLNSDQIKRTIEATNTLTQLKAMSLSSDKTIEFPLAKYAEIIEILQPNLSTVALGAANADPSFSDPAQTFEKSAGVNTGAQPGLTSDEFFASKSVSERYWILNKQASYAQAKMESFTCDSRSLASKLLETSKILRSEPDWQIKLACAAANESEYVPLARLAGDTSPKYVDYGVAKLSLYKKAELKTADKMVSLLRQGLQLIEQTKPYKNTLEKFAGVTEDFKRGLQGLSTAKGAVSNVYHGVDAALNTAGTAIHHGVSPIAKGLGSVLGGTVGGIAGGVVGGAKMLASNLLKSKQVMVNGQLVTKSRLPGLAGGAAIGGMNAMMYEPKRNLWDTLQRSA